MSEVEVEVDEPAKAATQDEPDDQLRRALADLDNLRKRYNRELSRERAVERATVAATLLPVIDDLERAIEHAGGDAAALIQGVQAVREHAVAVLERLGFPRFDDEGEQFDPVRHEAVASVEHEKPAGTIVSTARAGYGTTDGLLRPAGVVVSRGGD